MLFLYQLPPFSPYLFIIASEALSRGLNYAQTAYPTITYFRKRGLPIISHLAYADDVVIFYNGSARSLKMHNVIFKAYQSLTSQTINPQKSCFIAGSSKPSQIKIIKSITKFQQGGLPITYLGCLLSLADQVEAFLILLYKSCYTDLMAGEAKFCPLETNWSLSNQYCKQFLYIICHLRNLLQLHYRIWQGLCPTFSGMVKKKIINIIG